MHARGRCGSGEGEEGETEGGGDDVDAEEVDADAYVVDDEIDDELGMRAKEDDEAALVPDCGARTQNTASPSSPSRCSTAATSGSGFGQ